MGTKTIGVSVAGIWILSPVRFLSWLEPPWSGVCRNPFAGKVHSIGGVDAMGTDHGTFCIQHGSLKPFLLAQRWPFSSTHCLTLLAL